jgi:oligopeptide transport system substrate-binding protein
VADWLLEEAGERAGEYVGLIAEHLELAGRSEEAVEYLLQAGDRARALYAHPEAIRAYERALALLKEKGDDDRAARTLMKLGLTCHTSLDFEHARDAYDEGFALWRRAAQSAPTGRTAAPHALRSWQSEPVTLDPSDVTDWHSGVVLEQLFSGLVRYGPDMELLPEVATSWEVLDGGRTYVFHLRQDARWSDGAPVTAHDFQYACKRGFHPACAGNLAPMFFNIRGARAYHQGENPDPDSVAWRSLDEFTLALELEVPDRDFLYLMLYALPLPRHLVEMQGDTWVEPGRMVSNGPFRLESWQRGESLVLERNPRYHGRFDGNLQRVELFFGGYAAAFEAYEADRLEILDLTNAPPAEMDRMRQRHAGEYLSVPELATFHLQYDMSRPPFDDPRVRRAFALATDRARLADVTLRGHAFPATGGLVPPGMAGYSPGIAQPYHPAGARSLLAEAGYPEGRGFPEVELLVGQVREAIVEDLCAQWQFSLGVQVAGQAIAWASLLDRAHREPPHLLGLAWAAHYPDPEFFVGEARRARTHPAHAWQHAAYDSLAEEAAQATDQAERLRLVQQMDHILVEEAWMLPLFYGRRHLLVKPWVVRLPTSPILGCYWKDVVLEPH